MPTSVHWWGKSLMIPQMFVSVPQCARHPPTCHRSVEFYSVPQATMQWNAVADFGAYRWIPSHASPLAVVSSSALFNTAMRNPLVYSEAGLRDLKFISYFNCNNIPTLINLISSAFPSVNLRWPCAYSLFVTAYVTLEIYYISHLYYYRFYYFLYYFDTYSQLFFKINPNHLV